MNDKQNKPQADRPRWSTPRRARTVEASAGYLDNLPIGAVLAVPVRFGDEDTAVTLTVTKVSPAKFGVHQRRGFPARLLIGAPVERRVRRDELDCSAPPEQSETLSSGSEVTA